MLSGAKAAVVSTKMDSERKYTKCIYIFSYRNVCTFIVRVLNFYLANFVEI